MFDAELDPELARALVGGPAGAWRGELRALLGAALPDATDVLDAADAARQTPAVCAELEVRADVADLDAWLWIDAVVLAVVRRTADGATTERLVLGDIDAFPRLIASLVDRGPRPRPEAPGFELPSGALRLLRGRLDQDLRVALVRSLRDLGPTDDLEAVLSEEARRWVLAVGPGSELGDAPSTTDVIDVPSAGIWLVHGTGADGGALVAADPTVLWTMLSGAIDGALLTQALADEEAAG